MIAVVSIWKGTMNGGEGVIDGDLRYCINLSNFLFAFSLSSIGKQSSVDKERKDIKSGNISVWKIFSRTPLTDEQKQWLFHNHTECNEVQWLAYPHYTVPQKFLSFVLDHGVFYANAIEWAASAMEMSCLAAKNVALLTERYLNLTKPRSREGNQHEEL